MQESTRFSWFVEVIPWLTDALLSRCSTEVLVLFHFFEIPLTILCLFCICLTTLWFAINVPHSLHLFLQLSFLYASNQPFGSSLKRVWFLLRTRGAL